MEGAEAVPIIPPFDAKALAIKQFTSLGKSGLPLESFWTGQMLVPGDEFLEPLLANSADLVHEAALVQPDVFTYDNGRSLAEMYDAFAIATALRAIYKQRDPDVHAPSNLFEGVSGTDRRRVAQAYVIVTAVEHAHDSERDYSMDYTNALLFTDEDLMGVDALVPDGGKFYHAVDGALKYMKATDVRDDEGRSKGRLLGVTLTEGIIGFVKHTGNRETMPLPPLVEGSDIDVHINRVTPYRMTVKKIPELSRKGGSLVHSALEERVARRIREENERIERLMTEPTIPTPETRAEDADRIVWDENKYATPPVEQRIYYEEPPMYDKDGHITQEHQTWAAQQYARKKRSWKWSPTGIPRPLPQEPEVEIPAVHPSEMQEEMTLAQEVPTAEPEYIGPKTRQVKYGNSVIRYGSSTQSSILKSKNR